MEVYSSWKLYTEITGALSKLQQRKGIQIPYGRTGLFGLGSLIEYFDLQVTESCFIHLDSNSIVFL